MVFFADAPESVKTAPARTLRQSVPVRSDVMGTNPVLVGSPRRGDLGRLGEPSLPPMEVVFSIPDLRLICTRVSCRLQFMRMRHVARIERAHLTALQSQQRDGVAVITDKFHFKGSAVAMHQNRRANVAAHQPVFGQVASQATSSSSLIVFIILATGVRSRIAARAQAAATTGDSCNRISFPAGTGSNAYARPPRSANSTSKAVPS